jgi:hypothetical protein
VTKLLFTTVLSLLLPGCAGAAAGAVANAAINTATAAAVSGVRRANGECFTPCNPGHVCNKSTGLCDPLPCRGECRSDEKCVVAPIGEKCVPGKELPPLSQ